MSTNPPLHLVKLCVGTATPEDLQLWQNTRPQPLAHVTRMWPRRENEILPDGSLYWVFKGEIRARQKILGFEERIGADGIRRCAICLDREIILTRPQPKRAFQGWRYFEDKDTPKDIGRLSESEALPEEIAAALEEFGVF